MCAKYKSIMTWTDHMSWRLFLQIQLCFLRLVSVTLSVLSHSLTRQYNFWQISWSSMIRERGDSSCVRSHNRNIVTLYQHYVFQHDCIQRDTKSDGKPKLQTGEWQMSYVCIIAIRLSFNLLKPTGHVMHQQFNIQQLYALPTLYSCVLYLSENKQRLVPLTS